MSEFPPAPIDEFNRAFCLKCYSKECSRSQLHNSAFEKRTENWKSILFTNVPRADEKDSRFDNFRSKRFLPLNKISEISSFQFESKEPEPEEETPVTLVIKPPVENPPKTEEMTIPAPKSTKEIVSETNVIPDNTPFVQGKMIQQEGAQVIIEPGGTFSFNSDE